MAIMNKELTIKTFPFFMFDTIACPLFIPTCSSLSFELSICKESKPF